MSEVENNEEELRELPVDSRNDLHNQEIRKIIDELDKSEDALVNVGGRVVSTDLYAFAKLVDLFLSMYGLGGCRSISEFWDMIDNEDPVRLMLLEIVGVDRINRMAGGTGFGERAPNVGTLVAKAFGGGKPAQHTGTGDGVVVEDLNGMADFLHHMGANQRRINEAVKKARNRKIQNKVDLSDITNEALLAKDFDLDDAIDRMNEINKGGTDIKVSIGTIKNRGKT